MDLETATLRAVELGVQGRADPRLLIATEPRLPKPKKAARLIAGLANAATGRQALLLVGLRGTEIRGIDGPPSTDWWTSLVEAFPGEVPAFSWAMVDVAGAHVLAVSTPGAGHLVVARRGDLVVVPWFDGRRLVSATATAAANLAPPTAPDAPGGATTLSGWVERIDIAGAAVEAYRGMVELELPATPGVMADASCSATLLLAERVRPITLDVQVHPGDDGVAVARRDHGIDIRTRFRIRLYLAGAVPAEHHGPRPATAQLVTSLLLPGRSVSEPASMLLSPDPASDGARWIL